MDFEYTIENNQVTITKYTGSSKDVTIPNEIEGLPVTTIAIYAFYSNKLTSIRLPQNLTTIKSWVFCSNKLTSISLPNKFRTDYRIRNIFNFDLEELDNRNKIFIKPFLTKILEDYDVHHHFHDIIVDYIMMTSNELIQEVMEAKKN